MSGWQKVPLGEVVTLHYGKALDSGMRDSDGSVPVYGANGIKDYAEVSLTTGPVLVIGRKGSAGEVTRAEGPLWPLDVTYYTEHDEERIEFRFLEYMLRALNLTALAKGVKPGINRNDVYALSVALPPLGEQKRIVAVLDQAFAALDRARANAEANLNSVTTLLRQRLDHQFAAIADDACDVALEDAVHPKCGLSYGIVQPGDEVEDGLPIVRPVDLTRREVGLQGLKKILPRAAMAYARTALAGGELLLCVRGSTGVVSVAANELAGANVTRGIVPIRFDERRVLPDFAYFQFSASFIRDQIAAKTYGAALMQINIKDLRKLRFLVPDLEVQRDLMEKSEHLVMATDALRKSYKSQVADITTLRQSLLRGAILAN